MLRTSPIPSPGSPVFVKRTDYGGNPFYLVPFYKTDTESVSVVVRINADDGQFMEASYNDSQPMGFTVDPTEPFDPTLSLPWSLDFGVSAFHPLYTPKNVIVYPRSGKVELYWDSVVAADHYNIYRNGGIYRSWVRQPRYIDYGVVDGIRYEYQITAVSTTAEESTRTEILEATPTRERNRR
jgi:hypothetical protein